MPEPIAELDRSVINLMYRTHFISRNLDADRDARQAVELATEGHLQMACSAAYKAQESHPKWATLYDYVKRMRDNTDNPPPCTSEPRVIPVETKPSPIQKYKDLSVNGRRKFLEQVGFALSSVEDVYRIYRRAIADKPLPIEITWTMPLLVAWFISASPAERMDFLWGIGGKPNSVGDVDVRLYDTPVPQEH